MSSARKHVKIDLLRTVLNNSTGVFAPLGLVFTSDSGTSAITQKGQILILVFVLAVSTSTSSKMQMRLYFCLRRSRFHGEIRPVILALVLTYVASENQALEHVTEAC